MEAKDLRVGDVFLGANGELSMLVNAVRVEQEGGINVFNFTVDGNHNYFILAKEYEYGQTCVLVHNNCPGPGNTNNPSKPPKSKGTSSYATGGGKNAQHGRPSSPSLDKQISDLETLKKTVPKKEQKKIQAKINNLREKLAEIRRGENHSQIPKGGFQ